MPPVTLGASSGVQLLRTDDSQSELLGDANQLILFDFQPDSSDSVQSPTRALDSAVRRMLDTNWEARAVPRALPILSLVVLLCVGLRSNMRFAHRAALRPTSKKGEAMKLWVLVVATVLFVNLDSGAAASTGQAPVHLSPQAVSNPVPADGQSKQSAALGADLSLGDVGDAGRWYSRSEPARFGWSLFAIGSEEKGAQATTESCSCPPFLCVCGADCQPSGWDMCVCVAAAEFLSCFFITCSDDRYPGCDDV